MDQSGRFRPSTALTIAIVWGLLPLALYVPSEAVVGVVEHAVFFLCFPGWALAYFLCGGVHGGHVNFLPALCAVFTAMFTFAVLMLVFQLLRRRAG